MLSFFQASCVIWNRRVIRTKRSTTAVEMICVDTQWIVCTRSHNRSRRSQARGARGSIEIAKCAQRHKLARGPANLRGSRVEFQEMGDRFATLFERMVCEAMGVCLRVLKGSNESRFESYSVREQCIHYIRYYLSGLSRAHFFRQPFSR